ncbi:MAG: response regulator [Myxococcota bacterium]|nr:response regulator [Myxococcota bacterium]
MTAAIAFLTVLIIGGLLALFWSRSWRTACVPATALLSPVPTAPASPQGSVESENEQILIIDDDPLIRSFLRRGLSRRGLKPLLAEDAEEAKVLLVDNPGVQIVLLDFNLAGCSGAEVLGFLRKTRPDLSIVMMTGVDYELIADLEGIDGVLMKPFRLDDVIEKLGGV